MNSFGLSKGYYRVGARREAKGRSGQAGRVTNTSLPYQVAFSLPSLLNRMAQRILHERIEKKPRIRTGGRIKLSDADCATIRARYEAGATPSQLAKDYHMDTVDYIAKIAKGELRYKP